MKEFGTIQMKWIDFLLYNYRLPDIPVRKINVRQGVEDYRTREHLSTEMAFPIDHRYRIPGELIFDLDFKPPMKDYHNICDLANDIYFLMKDEMQEYPLLCHSGGGGFHIHVFKRNEEVRRKLMNDIIKKLNLKRLIDKEVIDTHMLNGRHMIREIGGRTFKSPGIVGYKSMIHNSHSFKPVTEKKDVIFPTHKDKDKIKESMDEIFILEVG